MAKPAAGAGQVGALAERIEGDDAGEAVAEAVGGSQHAVGRPAAPDLGIALVGEQQEAMAAGEPDETLQRREVGHRPLRVGGASMEGGDGAGKQFLRQRLGAAGSHVVATGRHQHRLGAGRLGGGGIDGVEGVGQQDGRPQPLGAASQPHTAVSVAWNGPRASR